MNTGYGWRTPMTTGGKMLTIFIIIIQAPFYLHCLATLAAKINRYQVIATNIIIFINLVSDNFYIYLLVLRASNVKSAILFQET